MNQSTEEVTLTDLGVDDFNPYSDEQHQTLILLPILLLVLVLLHVIREKRR